MADSGQVNPVGRLAQADCKTAKIGAIPAREWLHASGAAGPLLGHELSGGLVARDRS